MGKKEQSEQKERDRIEAVLQFLRKQTPLTVKQEKFCTDACIERFLKWKGDSAKKAAKHLRACLSWRDAIGADHVMADEFSAELAEGVAYVAGHDDEARPVLVFRIKQDYPKFHSQKSYMRLVAFTLEVAISSMSRFVEQFVVLFDASLFRSASAFLNLFMGTLKLLSEYYPGRLHRAFVIDPPSLFSYLWKGARPFVDLWTSTSVVSSQDFEDPIDDDPFSFSYYPRTSSLRYDPTTITTATATAHSATSAKAAGVGSASSRFSFTVSQIDSLKPWYLSRTECCQPTSSPSLVGVSPVSARSFSFASPGARATPCRPATAAGLARNNLKSIPSTPAPAPTQQRQPPRTPRPSFLQSPAVMLFFGGKKDGRPRPPGAAEPEGAAKGEKSGGRESFVLYLRFYRRPYDEMVYRSKMRPPLGGIVSIVSPNVIRQQRCRHVRHQRF